MKANEIIWRNDRKPMLSILRLIRFPRIREKSHDCTSDFESTGTARVTEYPYLNGREYYI